MMVSWAVRPRSSTCPVCGTSYGDKLFRKPRRKSKRDGLHASVYGSTEPSNKLVQLARTTCRHGAEDETVRIRESQH